MIKTIAQEAPALDARCVVYFGKTDEPGSAAAPERTQVYADAERRMRRGERLVITGFVLAMLGIAVFCVGAGAGGHLGVSSLV